MRFRVQACAIALGLAMTCAVHHAHAAPDTVYVLRNVRIVPVSGPAIDSGMVVVAHGLIQAVGASTAVPKGAWEIEGKGLTVYPGLFDGLTDIGLTSAAPPAAPGPGGAGAAPRPAGPVIRGPEDRPGSTPWLQAADEVKPDERKFETWRAGGFTNALIAPKTGLLPGQSAVIALAGDRPADIVVRPAVTVQASLSPSGGFGSFPASLMGVAAYLKQVWLDVAHYAAWQEQYAASPRGLERPAYDRTVVALHEAMKAKRPVMFPAVTATQIRRALALAAEMNVSPIILGAHQGYAAADALGDRKAPVVVSAKWPEKARDADPDADEPLRTLQFRDRAPSTPAALAKAGVPFAFTSDGLATPREVLRNVKRAIEAGLPADVALRALTLSPAEVFGVADRLGSIEAGKIANLVVADGDLFDDKTKVKMVFVDGRLFEIKEQANRPAAAPAAGTTAAAASLAGTWTLTINTPQGVQPATATIAMSATGALSGTLASQMGTTAISEGQVTGSQFQFTVPAPMAGAGSITFSGTVEGATMKGTFSLGQLSGDFTGTRPGAAGLDEGGAR